MTAMQIATLIVQEAFPNVEASDEQLHLNSREIYLFGVRGENMITIEGHLTAPQLKALARWLETPTEMK